MNDTATGVTGSAIRYGGSWQRASRVLLGHRFRVQEPVVRGDFRLCVYDTDNEQFPGCHPGI